MRAQARTIGAAAERGDRVYLRAPTKADQREWCALREASAEHLEPWEPIPPDDATPHGPDAFERVLMNALTETTRRFLLCRCDDEAILGMANLSQIFYGPLRNAILGYWIGAPHAGRGYGREGVRLALGHAFETLELHRVEANVVPGNTRSRGLALALGLREEGYSPRYLCIAGEWADHVRYAITAEEWHEHRGRPPGG